MNNSARIGIACACGAALGVLLAVVMCDILDWSRYCWPAGALIGGLVAYLGLSLREVKDAIVTAWRENYLSTATRAMLDAVCELGTILWSACRYVWPYALGFVFCTAVWYLIAGLWPGITFMTDGTGRVASGFAAAVVVSLVSSGVVGGTCLFLAEVFTAPFTAMYYHRVLGHKDQWPEPGELISKTEYLWFADIGLQPGRRRPYVALFWFPFALHVMLISLCLCGIAASIWLVGAAIWLAAKKLFGLGREIARLIWRVFTLIHSDLRMLCLVDATIGAAVGYFGGPRLTAAILPALNLPLAVLVWMALGAVSGAAWGLLNYQLISIRLLKLVPAKVVVE